MFRLKCWLGFIWAGLAFALAPAASADTLNKGIHDYVESIIAKGGTSASYAILQNGQLILADAVGHLDASHQQVATTDTLYNIGSISKVYTAAAVMALLQDGKIGLDEPVIKYLPDFQLNDPRYRFITVRMLLNHSSGMLGSDYVNMVSYGGYDQSYPEKQAAYFRKSILKADPGKFSVYCNDGFDLAQRLIARVSGMSFEDYLHTRLFQPLGLTSAGYATRRFAPDSYALMGLLPHEFMNLMGAGGASTNIVDLARFGQMFLDAGAGVLAPEVVAEMGRPQGRTFITNDVWTTQYGLGWDKVEATFADNDFGPGVLFKNGGTGQFLSNLLVIPKYNLVAAMSVTGDFAADDGFTLREIIRRVLLTQGVDTVRLPENNPPASAKPLPVNFERDFAGVYASSEDGDSHLWRVSVNTSEPSSPSISLSEFDGEHPAEPYKALRFNGETFYSNESKDRYRFVEAEGRRYIMNIPEAPNSEAPLAQKLEPMTQPLGSWARRLNKLYLPDQVDYHQGYGIASGIRLIQIKGLDGLIFTRQGTETHVLNVLDNQTTGVTLQIPGGYGRDLNNLWVTKVGHQQGLARNNYTLRRVTSLPRLPAGRVKISPSGANKIYRIPCGSISIEMPPEGRVIGYDKTGTYVYDNIPTDTSFSNLPASGFIRFAGPPGAKFRVRIAHGH